MSFYNSGLSLRNNDQIIGFSTTKEWAGVSSAGFQDYTSLQEWFETDPLKNHMKLQSYFGEQSLTRYPIFEDVLNHDAVMEVNGWEGKFTYDRPVETDNSIRTVFDNSNQEYAGADETTFKITLNYEFAPGTTLTCDGLFGDSIVVSDVETVKDLGTGFEHTVLLLTNDVTKSYPNFLLKKDIEYFETGHGLGEYGEKLAITRMPKGTNYMTCEFQLGSVQGAESYVTGKADSVNLGGGIAATKDYMDTIENFKQSGKEIVLLKDKNRTAGSPTRVGTMMEMLTLRKFNENMSTSLMFQRGATVKSQKGTVRYNEGLWHQMRRGRIISYGKRGGITREIIKDAVDYVFKINPTKKSIERRVKFKCGSLAFNNVLEIFKDEVNAQLIANGILVGAAPLIDIKKLVEGTDLYNLQLNPVRFTKVNLPGIGMVEIEEDMSLNYMNITDRNLRGMNANGYDHTAYSMIIWDALDTQYSNNQDAPKGTTIIADGKKDANIYMVMPEGEKIYWGKENGRYDNTRATGIVASAKTMHTSFFVYGSGAIWMKDPSKFVMVELAQNQRQGHR